MLLKHYLRTGGWCLSTKWLRLASCVLMIVITDLHQQASSAELADHPNIEGTARSFIDGSSDICTNLVEFPASVLFEQNNASLTARAQLILADMASEWQNAKGALLLQTARTSFGSATPSVLQNRLLVVEQFLIDHGVPGNLIWARVLSTEPMPAPVGGSTDRVFVLNTAAYHACVRDERRLVALWALKACLSRAVEGDCRKALNWLGAAP